MTKRKLVKAPPLQGTVYVRGSDNFKAEHAQAVLDAVGRRARKRPVWVAEALNDATETYYTAFAIAQMGTPSEQAEWAARLKVAAETCLQILSPEIPVSERPRIADHRVHSALFHNGEPQDISSRVAGPATAFGYDPVRDVLDTLPGALWDLRKMAEYAEERWRALIAPPGTSRREVDSYIITWIADLANIYERTFGTRAPKYPKPTSPFVAFAKAVTDVALCAKATEHGTDDAASARLRKLSREQVCYYARQYVKELQGRLKQARATDYVPYRIRLGVVPAAD